MASRTPKSRRKSVASPESKTARRKTPTKASPSKQAEVDAFKKRAELVFGRLAPDGTMPVHTIPSAIEFLGFKIVETAVKAKSELNNPVDIHAMRKGSEISNRAVLRMQVRLFREVVHLRTTGCVRIGNNAVCNCIMCFDAENWQRNFGVSGD